MNVWSNSPEYIQFTKGTLALYNGQEIYQHEFYMPKEYVAGFKDSMQKYLERQGYKSYKIPVSDKYRSKVLVNAWALPEDYEELYKTGMRSGVKIVIRQNIQNIEDLQADILTKDVKLIKQGVPAEPRLGPLPGSIAQATVKPPATVRPPPPATVKPPPPATVKPPPPATVKPPPPATVKLDFTQNPLRRPLGRGGTRRIRAKKTRKAYS